MYIHIDTHIAIHIRSKLTHKLNLKKKHRVCQLVVVVPQAQPVGIKIILFGNVLESLSDSHTIVAPRHVQIGAYFLELCCIGNITALEAHLVPLPLHSPGVRVCRWCVYVCACVW